MKTGDLKELFYPKTIAIIGASENENKVGGILLKKALKFKGNVIPINPAHENLFGKKCYSSIKDCPGTIDLAVIATPKETVKSIILECAKKRVPFVIIITAGFAEVGNEKTQREILNIAEKANIRILGPNCFGIFNPELNLDLTFANTTPKKGGIVFISQSGALWSYFSDIKNIGYSGYISLGNMSDLEFSDFIEFFNKDKKTKKIILYIEKLKNGKRFLELCKKSKKKIIAIKAGSSKQGSKAAISHTGSLATDFKIYEGAFRQVKITQIENLFSKIKIPKSNAIIITNAGGAGALISDACENKGVKVIKDIDVLGTALPEDYKKALEHAEKIKCSTIIVILTPQKMSKPEQTAQEIINSSKKTKKHIIACFLGEASISKAEAMLKKAGIYCFIGREEVKRLVR